VAAIRSALTARLATKAVTLPAAGKGERTAAAIQAARDGAALSQFLMALGSDQTTITPLPRRRFGEAFEAMRAESDRRARQTGKRPAIFLANLGPLATYTPRATFARNAFEAGGIQALDEGGFEDATALADAFRQSGTKLAVLCSSDRRYGEQAEEMAKALKSAGCTWLALAGNPGDAREAFEAAGVDDFIAMGSDLLASLKQAWAALDA
jgi:methylmalonyl-CoA mutase